MLMWIKEHKYCLWLLYLLFYTAAFFALEQLIEPRYIIECPIDNMIPFNEWFVFLYCLWYLTMPGSLLFFMFKEKAAFKRLCFVMFVGMSMSLAVYLIVPNALKLRVPIEHDNIAARLCMLLQKADTPTNVCPSIHVASALASDVVVQSCRTFKRNIPVRVVSFVIMIMICASTMFLKQHSVIDVLCGALMTLALFALSYIKPIRKLID